MTVKQLIHQLQQITHQEMRVVINIQNEGFDDIEKLNFVVAYENIDSKKGEKYLLETSGQGGTIMLSLYKPQKNE